MAIGCQLNKLPMKNKFILTPPSLRKLGLRYYQAFLNAADVTEALPDEDWINASFCCEMSKPD